jgi:hypothetical protein
MISHNILAQLDWFCDVEHRIQTLYVVTVFSLDCMAYLYIDKKNKRIWKYTNAINKCWR